MIKKAIWILLAVSVLAFVLGTTARGDERNNALPLIVLLSVVSIGMAFGLMVFGKRRPESTVSVTWMLRRQIACPRV